MNLDVDIDDMDIHLVVGIDIDFRSSLGAATGQDVSVVSVARLGPEVIRSLQGF